MRIPDKYIDTVSSVNILTPESRILEISDIVVSRMEWQSFKMQKLQKIAIHYNQF